MYSIGIDSGSVATKGVLFDGKKILKKVIIPTGWSPKYASKEAYNILIEGTDIKREDIKKIVGTGYGRVSMDFVDKTITEITCHAKGVHFLNSNVRTILDIGGQDSKVISLDDNGNVSNFIMNDKCAAGTGRFLQVMCSLLGSDVENIDELSSDAIPETISSMCTVFAESEVVSLLAQDTSKECIAAGILQSIANRASSMLQKADVLDEVAFTGGVAKSKLLIDMLKNNLKTEIYTSDDAQIIGALGAAVIGYNMKK
jgi:predicted CoA-substrate-specific enzyme activase